MLLLPTLINIQGNSSKTQENLLKTQPFLRPKLKKFAKTQFFGKFIHLHSSRFIRISFIRRLGSISRKIKKILRRSWGWILENLKKIEAEMCVYYINLRRLGSISWKIKKILEVFEPQIWKIFRSSSLSPKSNLLIKTTFL